MVPLGRMFGVFAAGSSTLLGKDYTSLLIYSMEKGIQDETDEHLRIMNERGIKEEEVRKALIQLRDSSYDFFHKHNIKPDIDEISKEQGVEYYLY
mmetsp:Transcript_10663/g.10778  ORF Transcript_10663/g.10778 Transcript_10663/m.10778 type:complete len:95 (+) Transcript_10663:561-845(+)